MSTTRRELGRNILAAASSLGLRTIGVRSVLSSGLLAACSSGSDRSARDAALGATWPDTWDGSAFPPSAHDASQEPAPDASGELPRDAGLEDAGSDATSARGKARVIVVGSGY